MIKMVCAQGEKVDFSIAYPFRILIGGSINSGKSQYIDDFLTTKYARNIERIYYFGNDKHHLYKSKIGLPSTLDFPRHSCIIIDNLYSDSIRSDSIKKLYDKSARKKWSIILSSKDLSESGRYSNYFITNSNYIAVSPTTNRLWNRKLAEEFELQLAYKIAYEEFRKLSHKFLMFNQSEIGNDYAVILAYISDQKVVAFNIEGIKKILFTKKELEEKFDLIESKKTFYAVKND